MKKTLIAVAALAAGAAFAQTSVTLYGIADAYVGVDSRTLPNPAPNAALGPLAGFAPLMNNTAVTPFVRNSQSVVNSGGLGPSRLGISVKEDLGNGLSAFTVFESEIQTDTGTTAGSARTSVVGLSGPLGRLSLGRQATPLKDGSVKLTDAQAESAFSAFSRAAAVSITNDRSPFIQRINNSIRYDLPDMDGFKGALAVGTANGADKSATADRVVSMSIGYVKPGSFAVGFSHQTERNGQNTVPVPAAPGASGVTPGSNKVTLNYLSGAFGTSVGKFTWGFGGGKVAGVSGNDKGWNLGWTAPIDNWTLIAQVASFKASGELGNLYNTGNTYRVNPALPPILPPGVALRSGGAKRTSLGLEAHYALSKRTTTYVGYNHTKNLAGVEDAKGQLFGVGMRHVF